MLEVLEELEEFSEREKDFENKYVKTISQLKSEAEKTDSELTKVKSNLEKKHFVSNQFRLRIKWHRMRKK